MVQNRNFNSTMEAGAISKNGASSKSHTSRVNIQIRQRFPKFGKLLVAISIAVMCMGSVHAQPQSDLNNILVLVIDADGKEKELGIGFRLTISIPRDDIFMAGTLPENVKTAL